MLFITNLLFDIFDLVVVMDLKSLKVNISVFGYVGKILVLEEGYFFYVFDGDLNIVGVIDFGGVLNGLFIVHLKFCFEIGEMLAFGYLVFELYLCYLRVLVDG